MKTPFVLFSFELAVISTESMTTNATKTFIGESSLTGAIVQTWAATAWILLGKKSLRPQPKFVCDSPQFDKKVQFTSISRYV